MKVKVTNSPYWTVKNGEIGVVLEKKLVGTHSEVWLVEFEDSTTWRFVPRELTVIEQETTDA